MPIFILYFFIVSLFGKDEKVFIEDLEGMD